MTQKSANPTITGKKRAASVNMFSDDSRVTSYRELLLTEKSAVRTITGKKAVSSQEMTTRLPVTEVCW